jgi:hypothetical protein
MQLELSAESRMAALNPFPLKSLMDYPLFPHCRFLTLAAVGASAVAQLAANPVFPLTVSDDHRYLVDQRDGPFFVLGDTPWFLQKLPANRE